MMLYYNDMSIPMPLFISATVDHDIKALLKEPIKGDLTQEQREELDAALLKMNSEHLKVLDVPETKIYIQRMQASAELMMKINTAKMLVLSLRIRYSEKIADALREDYPYDFDPADQERYHTDLTAVLTELTSDEIELERLEALEVAEKKSKAASGKTAKTRADFMNDLLEINHQEGVKYTMAELDLEAYTALLLRLKMHYKKPPKPAY